MHYLIIVLTVYIVALLFAPQQVIALTILTGAVLLNLFDWTTVPY